MKSTKVIQSFLIVTVVILLCIASIFTVSGYYNGIAKATDNEDVIIKIPDVSENFDDSCITVVMNKAMSAINKVYDKSYFGNQIESIEDLTYITGNVDDKLYLNKENFCQILKLSLKNKSKESVIEALSGLSNVNGIQWAGPNYLNKLSFVSNNVSDRSANGISTFASSSIYSQQWGLHGTYGINAPNAWNVFQGVEKVKVGVVDSGIAVHDDLSANLVEGWDFVNDNATTSDDFSGHGTMVAGIIGAVPKNGANNGVTGVCTNVDLVPLQVTKMVSGEEIVDEGAVVKAINWAINNDLDILNMSFTYTSVNQAIANAIGNYKGLIVCAAGDEGNDNDLNYVYPAYYAYGNNTLAVGAINSKGQPLSNSNYGAGSVSLFAPGESIISTAPHRFGDTPAYATASDTSMAAPFVTGAAALVCSMYKNIEYDGKKDMKSITSDVLYSIVDNVTTQSNLNGKCYTKGRLNAYEAVNSTATFKTTDLGSNKLRIDGLNDCYTGKSIYIPSKINGKTVTQIKNSAFKGLPELIELNLPSTLETIGANAFEETRINVLKIPASVKSISANAFANCQTIITFEIEANSQLTTIGNSAFFNAGISSTKSLIIPANVTTLGTSAFQGCLFKRVYFENGSKLKSIQASAFADCTKLENIDIPTNITTIGANAFSGCEKLTIYTAQPNRSSGWAGSWNSLNRPVVYGCVYSNGITSFTKSALNPSDMNAENGVNNPVREGYEFGGWYTTSDFSGTKYDNIVSAPNGTLYAKWVKEESSCIAAGTLITLADGAQKAVEDLTGDEMLLVWNMFTGKFDVAPILFIDKDPRAIYDVINLTFSDGTSVKVISEHAFWDFNLNKYVYLREDAEKYIGHWFNKQTVDENGDMTWTRVQLTDVAVTSETTTAYSPVTYGHLCYYVNGMLSMPGGIEGLINILDVDGDTMAYDSDKLAADIETYGLFTYEEFAELVPVSETIFNAVCGQYLKVAIGKGLTTVEELIALVERYSMYF